MQRPTKTLSPPDDCPMSLEPKLFSLPLAPAPSASVLLSALPVAVAFLDAEDRVRAVHPAAEQFFGLSAAQLLQLRLRDIIAADQPIFLLIEQVRRGGLTVIDYDMNLEGPRLSKHGVTVHGTKVPEAPEGVLLVLQEASAARTLNRQLNFRGAARGVAGMAAILAHEVKNPLSGIRGAAQLLEASVGPADRELAVLIRTEADRIRALVERMERFGDKPIAREALNIHEVLEHVRKLAQSGFAATLRISEFYDPSLPPVWGNRDQLVQVFLNLVKNAAEAIIGGDVPNGEIALLTGYQHGVRVTAAGTGQAMHVPLMVTVRDNGPGIREDIRHDLFEPFVTSKASGTGLGLALVAKIIGDHGGLVEVDSRPGRTEFRIFLPLAPKDAPLREPDDPESAQEPYAP